MPHTDTLLTSQHTNFQLRKNTHKNHIDISWR